PVLPKRNLPSQSIGRGGRSSGLERRFVRGRRPQLAPVGGVSSFGRVASCTCVAVDHGSARAGAKAYEPGQGVSRRSLFLPRVGGTLASHRGDPCPAQARASSQRVQPLPL